MAEITILDDLFGPASAYLAGVKDDSMLFLYAGILSSAPLDGKSIEQMVVGKPIQIKFVQERGGGGVYPAGNKTLLLYAGFPGFVPELAAANFAGGCTIPGDLSDFTTNGRNPVSAAREALRKRGSSPNPQCVGLMTPAEFCIVKNDGAEMYVHESIGSKNKSDARCYVQRPSGVSEILRLSYDLLVHPQVAYCSIPDSLMAWANQNIRKETVTVHGTTQSAITLFLKCNLLTGRVEYVASSHWRENGTAKFKHETNMS